MQENFSLESSTENLISQREVQDNNEYLDFLEGLNQWEINDMINNLSQTHSSFRAWLEWFQNQNWNTLLKELLSESSSIESIDNTDFVKKFEVYSNISNNIFTGLDSLQKNMNSNTSFSSKIVDEFIGLFADETIFDTYESGFNALKDQAIIALNWINEISTKNLSSENLSKLSNLQAELEQISKLQLESTGVIQMMQNDIYSIPQNIENAAYWVKWMAEWVIEWWIQMITWSIDLLTFLIKYPISSEYRESINTQAKSIYDYIEINWLDWLWDQVFQALDSEMNRITELPEEEQAEAIWNIAWNVISILAITKAGMTISDKLWKIAQTEAVLKKWQLTWSIWNFEKISVMSSTILSSKNGLRAFDILLNGVAETLLLKWLWKSYKLLDKVLNSTNISPTEKILALNSEILNVSKLEWNLTDIKIKEKYLTELTTTKYNYFDNLNRSEVWNLDNELRVEYGEYILERKLSPSQQKAIIDSHETGIAKSDGKYSIWDLKKKYIILQENWFSRKEIEILFDKKVCGRNEAIDKDKVDITELKWTYAFDNIEGITPLIASRRMEKFTNAIDVKYLVNNPKRVDFTLDIIESMSRYIEKNSSDIMKLSKKELNDFKYVFGEMKLKVDALWKSNLLTQFKPDILETRWVVREALLVLNPNLRPKL